MGGLTALSYVRAVFTISVAGVLGLSGCNSGRGPVEVKWDQIKHDQSQNLADVEKIMGGKGTEIPNDAFGKEDHDMKNKGVFASIADHYKGKRKLGQAGSNYVVDHTVPDENGTEVKWIRWDEDGTSMYVAVLDDKVFNKLRKGKSWPKRY